jgi:hypothetical protein
MSNLTRHEIPSDMRSKVQAVADALGKTCYVALMPDSSLVVTENQDRIEGAKRFWVFDPTPTP